MKINEKLLITNFIDPDVRFESQYGLIDGETWIKKERLRVGGCDIVKDDEGLVALIRLKPGAEKKYFSSVNWVRNFGKSK